MRKRYRADLLFDEGVRGWIYKYAKRNYWRVAGWYELADLVHDGYEVFFHLRQFYPNVTEQRHIMSLLKISFARHVHDLANDRTKLREVAVSRLIAKTAQEKVAWEGLLGTEEGDQPLLTLLGQAPKEVHDVIELMLSAHGRRMSRLPRRKTDGLRETFNETLCRLLGYDPSAINLINRTRRFIERGV